MKVDKQIKFFYYVQNLLRQVPPRKWYEKQLKSKLAAINQFDKAVLMDRVNYYNKLMPGASPAPKAEALKDMKIFESPKEYRFDAYEYTRYFDGKLKASFLFGDTIHTEPYPTLQKSRPVDGDNANAILFKLNKARHYVFVKDSIPFAKKKEMLMWRGAVYQDNRISFFNQYFDNAFCDIGQVNDDHGHLQWLKPRLTIPQQLEYKFILSIEGNDVATNLKWIMSSNSIAVMPKPKYETWFMEGRLVPGQHYILIKDDFSDLEEQLNYYINHSGEANAIIANANQHVQQFLNKKQEDLVSLLVLQKYFYCTGQEDIW